MKKLKVMLILVAITVAACQESESKVKENTKAKTTDELAMSNCDATCKTNCCTYPDKEKGGCLCSAKGTDCTAHCCDAHEKGNTEQSHGDEHDDNEGKEDGNDHHKH